MSRHGVDPIVLELAPLPREQIGPFLLLGIDKSADARRIEANWAQRVVWARKNQLGVGLEDINWAREVLGDPDRRVASDVTSLNPDTSAGTLLLLQERYGVSPDGQPAWQPHELPEALVEQLSPPSFADAADPAAAAEPFELPPTPPAVARLLEAWIREPMDPWSVADLPGLSPDEVA